MINVSIGASIEGYGGEEKVLQAQGAECTNDRRYEEIIL